MIEKEKLRKIAKEKRNSLDIKQLSAKIVENIKKSDIYRNANHIMVFYPLENEVDLLDLLTDNKNFYLPKVDGENILVCPYKYGDELLTSSFRTKEPLTKPINPEILDIIFVPALMVDKKNIRLGYGGGFYDKFLSKNAKNAKKIVAIPNALITEELPTESFDEKIDVTICEFLD